MSALAAGLEAAKKAGRNKREIDEKLTHISEMVFIGTDRTVKLAFDPSSSHREAIIGNLVYLVYAISASDPKKGEKIATVVSDREQGYPVIIDSASANYVCAGADEIESAFADIVQTTAVSNVFYKLMVGET
ncbi:MULTISPECIES: hypothetical protein [unclassified Pseudomonas]|uniref:hypothetical protein n=1 Tax=unclassified Pseudomonas TaxID=196821 RepID=UPI001CBBDBFC|nr:MULTISPECIES: hypothetical protein [unclassified Pseudomonas]